MRIAKNKQNVTLCLAFIQDSILVQNHVGYDNDYPFSHGGRLELPIQLLRQFAQRREISYTVFWI